MTKQNTLRKAAILITALDTRSADQLLDQMPESQAARVREAVFELDDIDPQEQQQILSEFLRSTGRSPKPAASAMQAAEHGVELQLSASAQLPQATSHEPPPASHATHNFASQREAYLPAEAAESPRPFDFLTQLNGVQLAHMLTGEHPQTIAVVMAHLPAERAAEMADELPANLQADVLRRLAELAHADPESLADIEQELRRSFQESVEATASPVSGMTTVSSILAAAGKSREGMLRNIRQHDRQLSQRIGGEPATSHQASHLESYDWPSDQPAETYTRHDSRDLTSEIEAHRRLAHSAQQASAWHDESEQEQPPTPASADPTHSRKSTVEWTFAELEGLSDQDLARVLQAAESDLTMVALAGAEPALVARLTNQLPPALARQFTRRIETVGPLKLRDIEAAQAKIAQIAADLAEQGMIAQKAARPFAMAA
jgi:flagellar motor switch protein FliG